MLLVNVFYDHDMFHIPLSCDSLRDLWNEYVYIYIYIYIYMYVCMYVCMYVLNICGHSFFIFFFLGTFLFSLISANFCSCLFC